jgi:hypothetical protein
MNPNDNCFSRKNDEIITIIVISRKSKTSDNRLGYREFGMGREWGGVEKGEVSLRVT